MGHRALAITSLAADASAPPALVAVALAKAASSARTHGSIAPTSRAPVIADVSDFVTRP
jgi:hypothetical protein